jgi:hypothetical protein
MDATSNFGKFVCPIIKPSEAIRTAPGRCIIAILASRALERRQGRLPQADSAIVRGYRRIGPNLDAGGL